MKSLWIVLTMVLIQSVADAGISGVVGSVFGPGGIARPVIMLVGISIGRWVLVTLCSTFGHSTLGNGIDVICKCAAVGLVLQTVWTLIDGTFNLMGV